MSPARRPTRADYEELLSFRTALRRFLRWSEGRAREVGLTPAQHQLLLAIVGHPGEAPPTVGELSDYLVLKHHSVVELIDRAVDAGLVERQRDAADHRIVHLALTPSGRERIEELSRLHLEELRNLPRWPAGQAPRP
ncbi:MAG TPA: MarR family winged helix-turn-helix transcriptional regulator [Solirubrobacterales bacterium]|nr:MarR family winged helix-turn-helix transcriptional regulator [Solirubrobacterales bacterium]